MAETHTLMWVGGRFGQVRQLRLPAWALLTGGALSCLVLAWAVLVTLDSGRIGIVRVREEASLHRALAVVHELETKMEEQGRTLERLRMMEEKLGKVLALGDKRKIFDVGRGLELSFGKGGPEGGLGGDPAVDLLRLETRIKGRLDQDFRRIEEAARVGEGAYANLNEQLRQAKTLAASTPRGFPAKGWITSGYGTRMSPIHKSPAFHRGVDIANGSGTPIRATAEGVVMFAGVNGDYGRLVVLRHGRGLESRYGHLRSFRVRPGARVERGDVIGYMGTTGASTGTHVHYEVWKAGRPVDPKPYLLEGKT